MTILIIDDEARIRELVQACLEDLGGWATLTAASGKEGLEIAQRESSWLNAILLDVSMPEIDGFTVYTELQVNPATKSIPVILLTAKVQASDRLRFHQMGVAGVITKPFSPTSIAAEIAEILGWEV